MYGKSKRKVLSGFNPVLGDLYSVISLTGETEDEVYSILGVSFEENEKKLLERYSATKNAPFLHIVYYHRLVKSFWYRNYESAVEYCEKCTTLGGANNLLRITDINALFFGGLSSLILSRKKKQKELMAQGEDSLSRMQNWAQLGCKWNAENKALLLEAEVYFAKGDSAKAKNAYERSLVSAHKHKFIHEEALAYELYGIFCVEEGNLCDGNDMLEKARELYDQWGAKKKAGFIFPL